jgi:hypothetical protein
MDSQQAQSPQPPYYGDLSYGGLGINVTDLTSIDIRQPVLYLQLDNLKLARARGGGEFPP